MARKVEEELPEIEESEELEPLWEDDQIYLDNGRPGRTAAVVSWLALVAAIVAIVLVFLFRGGRQVETDGGSVLAEVKLQALEERMNRLEQITGDVDRLSNRMEEFGAAFSKQLEKLGSNVADMEGRLAKAEAPPAVSTPVPVAPRATPGPARYHTVRRGETLYGISRTYGLTVSRLIQMNALDPNAPIYVGQRLLVKAGG